MAKLLRGGSPERYIRISSPHIVGPALAIVQYQIATLRLLASRSGGFGSVVAIPSAMRLALQAATAIKNVVRGGVPAAPQILGDHYAGRHQRCAPLCMTVPRLFGH